MPRGRSERVVEGVFTEPEEKKENGTNVTPPKPSAMAGARCVGTLLATQVESEGQMSTEVVKNDGRGERI
jgi:hypothetical protein